MNPRLNQPALCSFQRLDMGILTSHVLHNLNPPTLIQIRVGRRAQGTGKSKSAKLAGKAFFHPIQISVQFIVICVPQHLSSSPIAWFCPTVDKSY